MTTRICDLPPKLVGEKILTKVPITSLREVRLTCKLWLSLSQDWILGQEAAATRQQFLGFMTMDDKVCSLKFNLRKEENLIDLSFKQVETLNQVEISKVFYSDGLLLCVAKDNSRLVAWNPYLGQTITIRPRTSFHRLDNYAIGYDKKTRNHKILRLEVTPDWEMEFFQRGVSVKGNSYFYAQGKLMSDLTSFREGEGLHITDCADFLLCFDFTREKMGPRLPLPFHAFGDTVTLSCVRQEQLAALYQQGEDYSDALEVWVTTRVEPEDVSWSMFLKVDMKPHTSLGVGRIQDDYGSFFIDEEEKVVVVFDVDGFLHTEESPRYHTAFVIGEDGYFKTVSLGEAPNIYKLDRVWVTGHFYVPQHFSPPLVCSSSYLPSLVQLN
ncbi:unnamed protein product [Microthlaspi erraticum]|uniref:F-box associated beta-propeller type 1 domain-containing protein n=1 Tax=Microthlaspi erraticum TaxID=1685480 RepID=A0A6D2ICB4_9BRAS|nr:unnamed protein product [Microthlaspi erraticum]